MSHPFPGVLINFEGCEGSGKSTQAELLLKWLVSQGFDFVLTREPGGTQIGEQVRSILLNPENTEMDGVTEAYKYCASRRQHVVEKLFPRLRSGKGTITDRFLDSSIAYQGGGRNLGVNRVLELNKEAVTVEYEGGSVAILPDITFLVNIPAEGGLKRKQNMGELDRLERERLAFHQRVEQVYVELARGVHTKYFERILGSSYPYALVQAMEGKRQRTKEELEQEIRAMIIPILKVKNYKV